MGWSIVRN